MTNYKQVANALAKLLQSEKMWSDLKLFVRAVYPALLLLRLADRKKPAMDQLYFYVRRMNDTIARSKTLLDDIEKKYNSSDAMDTPSRMIKYYLDVTGNVSEYTNELRFGGYADTNDPGDDSDSEPNELPDDDDDDEESHSDDIVHELTKSLGDKVVKLWKKRALKLTHDLSITAWVLSPNPEIMKDADSNRTGEHQIAVERLIKTWFGHEVSYSGKCNVIFYIYDLLFSLYVMT
jgi:hypothetical protein